MIKKISQIKKFLEKNRDKKIVLIPTMGALHLGHLSLVKKAKKLGDIVVVSIFVNKTQFNDLSDFKKYPKNLSSDLEKLKKLKVDYVFTPDDEEIFADDFSIKISENSLTNCLCGSSRAGHFDGVALIITKLFNIIKPNIAIFGQKDFQQLKVIQKLTSDLNFDVKIIGHDIIREKSGLAMSSRNQRLDEQSKIKAANIYRILTEIKSAILENPNNLKNILKIKKNEFLKLGFGKIDYLEIRQENDLKLVEKFNKKIPSRIFIAVYLGEIRLIDNLSI